MVFIHMNLRFFLLQIIRHRKLEVGKRKQQLIIRMREKRGNAMNLQEREGN